jgi:hypothetical protein
VKLTRYRCLSHARGEHFPDALPQFRFGKMLFRSNRLYLWVWTFTRVRGLRILVGKRSLKNASRLGNLNRLKSRHFPQQSLGFFEPFFCRPFRLVFPM